MSTVQQETALQQAAFERAGIEVVYEEKRSAGGHRPVLEALLRRVKRGDTVVVYKIDRLARSLADLLRIIERLGTVGAAFRSLTEPLETQTPVGRMMLQLLGTVAEFERAVIRERCHAGRAAYAGRGGLLGRPIRYKAARVRELKASGFDAAEIAAKLGCAKSTVYRVLRGERVIDGAPSAFVP